MSDITVEADAFAMALEGILGDVDAAVAESVKEPVRKGAQTARKGWRSRAPKRTGRYAKSIQYTVKGSGRETHAEIGSKTLPGLPHLLEKGHATVGGGYVPGKEHIAPAAEEAFSQFEDDVSRAVEEALGSV